MNLTKSEVESVSARIKNLFQNRELIGVDMEYGVRAVESKNEYKQWEKDGTLTVKLTFGELK